MPGSERRRVAVYERTIAASVARIWENVLDWEHLPWLHATTFASVRRTEESDAGWRAWVATRASHSELLVDVQLDRPALRYVTRTLEGDGAGTEIWTSLEPVGPRATKILVGFYVPFVDAEQAERIGAAYGRLYERLWAEDEAMMMRRQTILDDHGGRLPRAPEPGTVVPLGPIGELRKRLPLPIRAGGIDLRVIEIDGEPHAHPTVCPHLGGPLGDAAVEHGCVTCPWHGYRYDLHDGRCVNGELLHLGPLPRVRIDARSGEAALLW